MNIVKPFAKIMGVPDREAGIAMLRRVEWAGRISHRSEDARGPDTWQRFIQSIVLDHGDWSITEHQCITVDMLVDRGITHEIVRHRLFSFTQESTRFCNYGKKGGEIAVIEPAFESGSTVTRADWCNAVGQAEAVYLRMLHDKVAPQMARSVLPNSLASRIIVTGNLRNWRHFLIMRTTAEAHPQMREVSIPLLADFKARIPLLYDDIQPLAKQSEGMKRAR